MGKISEELLLALAVKNSGGGGTSNYNDLSNKPQIAGTTLSGNKSLADLGIASATTVSGILDGASIDSFADVETALAGKQGTLTFDNTPTENSTNPVKSGGIYSALAGKADTGIVADDFDSTASYVIGNYCIENGKLYRFKANHSGAWSASDVDEIQITGELATLKSGLTNVDVALSVPENTGKNVLPLTLAGIKSANTGGTWNDNAYTYNGITYTVYTTDGRVIGIKADGTATDSYSRLFLCPDMNIVGFNGYKMNGCPEGGENKYSFVCQEVNSPWTIYGSDQGNGATISNAESSRNAMIFINVKVDIAVSDLYFYPMIRPATITDPTFAPYIPSVESRLEAVESGLNNKIMISNYPLNLVCLNDISVSFTNGDGITDVSSYIPSGYQISFVMASPVDTYTISVTGCSVYNNKKNIRIKCRTDFTGNADFNIMLFVRKSS